MTIQRGARILQWLSDHWPEGAEWPADIPRPTPSPDVSRSPSRPSRWGSPGRAPARPSGGGAPSAAAVLAEVRTLDARRRTALDDVGGAIEAARIRDEMLAAALHLGPDGRIVSPLALCLALGVPRRTYDRVVETYADGGPRARQQPRQLADGRRTDTKRMHMALVGAGDVRFASRRPRAAA